MLFNKKENYGVITKLLHWSIAGLIMYLLYLGISMDGQEREIRMQMMGTHKSLGVLVLGLSLVFYVWKIINKKPDQPVSNFRGQKFLSSATKGFLLLIMSLYPITGTLMSMAGGHTVSFFGYFDLPNVIEKGQVWFGFEVGKIAHTLHEGLMPALIALISLHVLGALYHHFIAKDDVLKKMTTKF